MPGPGPRGQLAHSVLAGLRMPGAAALNDLCQVPVSLLRESGADFDEYIYDGSKHCRRTGSSSRASATSWSPQWTAPTPRYSAPLAKRLLNIMYPPMNLLTQLVRGDQDRFNTELATAVEWHKDYWTRDEERARDSDGLIALGPLAISCLALGSGFTVKPSPSTCPSTSSTEAGTASSPRSERTIPATTRVANRTPMAPTRRPPRRTKPSTSSGALRPNQTPRRHPRRTERPRVRHRLPGVPHFPPRTDASGRLRPAPPGGARIVVSKETGETVTVPNYPIEQAIALYRKNRAHNT